MHGRRRRRSSARTAGTALALAIAVPVAAQSAPDPRQVQPERPTVATHAGTVASGFLEIESGVEFDRLRSVESLVAPTVLKFGIGRHTQLSVLPVVVAPPKETFGLGDVTVGVKWRMVEAAPVLGDFAIFPALKFPTGSERLGRGTGTTDVSLLLISSHAVGPIAVDINAGLTKRNGDIAEGPRTSTLWTLSLGGPLWGATGWVAELYGYPDGSGPSSADPIVALLAGPTLLARRWLALDAGVIVPLTGPQPRAFFVGGVYNVGRWRR